MNSIYINQLGYLKESVKYFLTNRCCNSFNIVGRDNKTVYSGDIKLHCKSDPSTGEELYIGFFSSFDIEGEYKIVTDSGDESYFFKIAEDLYNEALYSSLKSFYFQRCGTDLKEEIVGKFQRGKCHSTLTEYHPTTGKEGSKDVTGGWHDAGDYGRYITPASITLAIMLLGFDNYSEKFNFTHLGLSDNKTDSDFIGEIRYEIEWMFKMQELDEKSPMYGALHYMVNSNTYTWDTPENDSEKQYILDYSSLATADFAAIMAFVSRVFRDIDVTLSEKALNRSLIAWDFIDNREAYPPKGFKRPDTMITGGYAEKASDNRFTPFDKLWPAVELFLATGNDKFDKIIKRELKNKKRCRGGLNWMDRSGFPEVQYIMSNEPWVNKSLQKQLKKRFLSRCNTYLKNSEKDGFFTVLKEREYLWGSNGELLTRGVELILAYIITENNKYYNAALNQLNYIFGLNINSISYVAGGGTNYPKNIHHASFVNDGIDECFPGMLTGGPNRRVNLDKALKKYVKSGTPGAKCYVDHIGSYSSNENCILYSAPIIPLLAFFTK